MEAIKLIECPRDAIQGYQTPITTSMKIAYYQMLLKVGYYTLDCGSFVNPKAIPQMAIWSSLYVCFLKMKLDEFEKVWVWMLPF